MIFSGIERWPGAMSKQCSLCQCIERWPGAMSKQCSLCQSIACWPGAMSKQCSLCQCMERWPGAMSKQCSLYQSIACCLVCTISHYLWVGHGVSAQCPDVYVRIVRRRRFTIGRRLAVLFETCVIHEINPLLCCRTCTTAVRLRS
jgi:hypothetical protein